MHNIMCIHNIIYIYIYMKYYRMKLHYIIHCASMEWQSSDKSMAGSPIFLFFASHQYGSIVNGYPCWDTTNIWLVVEPTPLKNDGVRQLGWFFHSQYDGKVKKFHGSKAPTRIFFLPCGKKTPFTLLDLPHPSGRYPTSRKVLVDGSDYARQTREGQP